MSSEWGTFKLGDVGNIITGKTPATNNPEFKGSEVPFITPPDFNGNKWIRSSIRAISEKGAQSVKNSIVPAKSVLVTCIGSDMGKVALASERCVTNQQINTIVVNDEEFCREFIYYNLSLRKDEIKSLAGGSAQPILNKSAFSAVQIACPNIEEQKAIVSLIKPLDDRIALLRETNATLEAIAQALFKSWFVDFDPVHANAAFLENGQAPSLPAEIQALFPSRLVESPQGLIPEGWEVFRLGDVTERITKGTTPTTLKKAFTEEGINFVKVESLTESGEFITEKFSFIDEETHQLLKRSQLKSGDVLVTIAGTIGRVAEVTEDIIPANTNQAVALIRPIQEKLPSGLIRRFLQRNDSKQHMGERVVQAVQANLSLGSLSDMAVVVPPESVVSKLHELGFEHIDTSKNNNMRQIKTLTNLRDTLLPRLISGQLRLTEAEAALAEV